VSFQKGFVEGGGRPIRRTDVWNDVVPQSGGNEETTATNRLRSLVFQGWTGGKKAKRGSSRTFAFTVGRVRGAGKRGESSGERLLLPPQDEKRSGHPSIGIKTQRPDGNPTEVSATQKPWRSTGSGTKWGRMVGWTSCLNFVSI